MAETFRRRKLQGAELKADMELLEKRADVERMESQMDDFVDKIQATLESANERASYEDKIRSMEIPDKVREKALHCHQLAETSK